MSSVNPRASFFATLVANHLQELNLIPEQFLQKREEMIASLTKYLSENFCSDEGQKADRTDDDMNVNDALPDDLFFKDMAQQIGMATGEGLIKLVSCWLVEAGMEKEAQDYVEKVRAAISSGVEIESMRIWYLFTMPYEMFQQMRDMRVAGTSASFELPSSAKDLLPFPHPDRQANRGNNPGSCLQELNQTTLEEAEIVAGIEEATSISMVDTNPTGVLLVHIGEVTVHVDPAPEETQLDIVEVVEMISSDA